MNDILNLENNKIIGEYILDNSKIEFKGENNILYLNGNITFKDSIIRFTGNNSIIFIDENKYPIIINARVSYDSVLYIGKKVFISKGIDIYATERKNIIIGNECMLSYKSTFRTTDPHLIFDSKTKNRINPANSILIGDHVWIGQECLILKNTKIYSGSVIGGHSVLSNKEVLSNTLWAGNPAKKIKQDIFFTRHSAHDFTEDDIGKYDKYESDDYIFENYDCDNLNTIDEQLLVEKNVKNKIDIIMDKISNNENKNRFAKK